MSTHCSRYPACGCAKDIGTKCHLPFTGPNEATEKLTQEVVGKQNPELKAAYDALSDYDKEMLKRGYKIWKVAGKKYTLVDADPTDFNFGPKGITRKQGSNVTPKKKKRKK